MTIINNTKKLNILIISVIVALSLYYYFAIFNSVTTIDVHASYKGFDSVDELYADSDLVLVGMPTKDYMNNDHKLTYYPTGDIQDVYTDTNIKIDKVLKGSITSKEIDIVEPYSIVQGLDGKRLISYEGYTPLQKDSKYVLFLKKNTFGKYSIINMQQGKFNLDNSDKKDYLKEDGLAHEQKKQLKKDIESKYLK